MTYSVLCYHSTNYQITQDMLSDYQESTYPKEKLRPTKKLTPNLMNKRRYIIHYANLKYYLAQGLILKKVPRVLTFKQSPWLKKCVDFNFQKRSEATTGFEKNFFKLMNNAVFGRLAYHFLFKE